VDEGRVEAIYITDTEGRMPEPVERVNAHAGKGLAGNRYYFADGHAPAGNALTLIAAEAIKTFTDETGIPLTAQESRRNVLTRGIDLNALVGRHFTVGGVRCLGVELCEPCTHLEAMTRPGVIKGMAHRAGLNADILADGEIAVGDSVVAEG
jgi:MOSC domain-containing protein YiiM